MDYGPKPSAPAATGSQVAVRGRRWIVAGITQALDCAAVRLQEIGRDRALTLLTPFDRLRPVGGNPLPRIVKCRRWLHDLDRALVQLHPFGSLRATAQAPIRLRPYQLEPALAVLRDGVSRLLIADSVGLGKTIQAGLLLVELANRHETMRALVLTPAGLRGQWLEELILRFGLAPIPADSAWLRATSAERPAQMNPWALPGIYIASHDLVKRPEVLRPLEDVRWDAVVIDEAHAATVGTDRRAALHAIAARSRHVVLLTATPHRGDPAERAALCGIGCVNGDDEPIMIFERSRADVDNGPPRKSIALSVAPSDNERRMHDLLDRYSTRVWEEAGTRGDDRARLVSIVLRKRALSSAASLQSSVERRLALLTARGSDDPWQLTLPLSQAQDEDPLEDGEPSAVLSIPGLADPKRERRWLAAITDAARAAAGAERKTLFLLRLLARIGEPVIVFTEYRDTLTRLAQYVAGAGHRIVVLHGGLIAADRRRVQQAFNEQGGTLLATDAASEGLNLHHRCRVVIHYELPWNPARMEQRAGRVDRFGQNRRVHELALVAADTAERLVIAPLIARLRTHTTGHGDMLDALTESRVAAAVMTNGEPRGECSTQDTEVPSCAANAPADLGRLAVREAARLEYLRRLAARSSRRPGMEVGTRVVVSTLKARARLRRGLILVYGIQLSNADGSSLHAEARAAWLEVRPKLWDSLRRSAARRREVVADLMRAPHALLTSVVTRGVDTELDALIALEKRRRLRQQRRERAIAGAQTSAAQLMVQAGLFDRRSLRHAASHAASVAARQEESHERVAALAPDAPTTLRADLISALWIPGCR
jgi:superfamily II DNA or RNA helicase